MQVFTHSFAPGDSLVVNSRDNAVRMTVKANGGAITVLGNQTFKGITPTAVTLNKGESAVLDAQSLTQAIDGVTITPVDGNADVMIAFG